FSRDWSSDVCSSDLPPILTEIDGKRGWLTLWHAVEPSQLVGIYRTYWSLLDPDEPWKVIATSHPPLLEANPELTLPLEEQMYLRDVVFTTGIYQEEDHFIEIGRATCREKVS